jgi:hypothetical protein
MPQTNGRKTGFTMWPAQAGRFLWNPGHPGMTVSRGGSHLGQYTHYVYAFAGFPGHPGRVRLYSGQCGRVVLHESHRDVCQRSRPLQHHVARPPDLMVLLVSICVVPLFICTFLHPLRACMCFSPPRSTGSSCNCMVTNVEYCLANCAAAAAVCYLGRLLAGRIWCIDVISS